MHMARYLYFSPSP